MTEQDWLVCTDPHRMVEFLRCKVSDRKLQLFCCACCLGNAIARDDDEPNRAAYLETLDWVDEQHRPLPAFWRNGTWWPQMPFDWAKACSRDDDPHDLTLAAKADLLRCIFGPVPFRPLAIGPTWRTPTVTRLAETIYLDRAFDRLPILGDALEEAGCSDADVLNHIRQPGVHASGCWVIDLLLGRK